jgi:hypothetical protein
MDLTYLLLLVSFIGLCRILEKVTGNLSNKLLIISRVPLILVSNIVKVQSRKSASPILTRKEKMMIRSPPLAICFTSALDH